MDDRAPDLNRTPEEMLREYHRDLYDSLGPLTMLIEVNPHLARQCVALAIFMGLTEGTRQSSYVWSMGPVHPRTLQFLKDNDLAK
jgi:hypothetical protein